VSDLQHLPHGHLLHFLSPTNQASVAAYLTLLQARQYAPAHSHEGAGRGKVIARPDFLRRGHRRHVDAPQKGF